MWRAHFRKIALTPFSLMMAGMDTALIIGAGQGLSASLARLLAKEGWGVAVAARNAQKLEPLAREIGGLALACDATEAAQVDSAFTAVERQWGVPDLVVYNASFRTRGPVTDLDPRDVEKALAVCALGGFLVGQAAAKRMLGRGSGAIFFTGASASVKGYAQSAPFAMGKFALRGLAQSLARELAPKNIHVAHFVIDGGIRAAGADPREAERGEDAMLRPQEIAKSYLHVYRQHRSAWSWEMELRPWVERF
jgi:NAD(P)-dependent dehydrogenase (short-subunit alcohol dehydrogenase family)